MMIPTISSRSFVYLFPSPSIDLHRANNKAPDQLRSRCQTPARSLPLYSVPPAQPCPGSSFLCLFSSGSGFRGDPARAVVSPKLRLVSARALPLSLLRGLASQGLRACLVLPLPPSGPSNPSQPASQPASKQASSDCLACPQVFLSDSSTRTEPFWGLAGLV